MAIRSPLFSFDLEETDRQKSNIICFLSSCSNDPLIPCESHHSRRCCWTFQLMFASDLWSLSNRRKKKLTYLNDQSSSIVLNCAFVRCVHAPSSCSVSVLTVVCLGVGLDPELSFLVTDGLCLFLLLWCSLCRPSCPFLRWLSVSIAPPPPPMPQLTPQIPLTGFVARMQESSKWRG